MERIPFDLAMLGSDDVFDTITLSGSPDAGSYIARGDDMWIVVAVVWSADKDMKNAIIVETIDTENKP